MAAAVLLPVSLPAVARALPPVEVIRVAPAVPAVAVPAEEDKKRL